LAHWGLSSNEKKKAVYRRYAEFLRIINYKNISWSFCCGKFEIKSAEFLVECCSAVEECAAESHRKLYNERLYKCKHTLCLFLWDYQEVGIGRTYNTHGGT